MNVQRSHVAVVTGGGRRLGRQIALALGREGFDVLISYLRSRNEASQTVLDIRAMGVSAYAVKADISRKRDVDRMISEAIRRFGTIDLLVNNAAVFLESPLAKTTEQIWDTTLSTNLKGPFLCAQSVAPHMLKAGRGQIINIASLGGLQPWKKHLPYSVSKAGVVMLTRILAKELAPSILVNAIAPGIIYLKREKDEEKKPPVRTIPLERYGSPSDVASMVIYLAKTANYITGQVFAVDGGKSAV